MTTGVVVGFRNREPIRLKRFLKTLSAQTVLPSEVVVINFGNSCSELEIVDVPFSYIYRHFPQGDIWCRGLAFNQGVRLLSKSKAVLFTDVDMLFASNFIEHGHQFFEDFSNVILNCQAFDLAEGSLHETTDVVKEFEQLRSIAFSRDINQTGACQWLLIETVHALRGHDEEYKLWHANDGDFQRRAIWHGLQAFQLYPETCFLHQWHPSRAMSSNPHSQEILQYDFWAKQNRARIEKRYEEWNKGTFSPSDVNMNGWGLIPNLKV